MEETGVKHDWWNERGETVVLKGFMPHDHNMRESYVYAVYGLVTRIEHLERDLGDARALLDMQSDTIRELAP